MLRIILVLLLLPAFIQAQNITPQGATNQVNYQRGGNGADSAFAIPVFADTNKANTFLSYRKEGRIIYTRAPKGFWYNDATKWVLSSTGTSDNFANANLTFDGPHTHDVAGNTLTITNSAANVFQSTDGSTTTYMGNTPGYAQLIHIGEENSSQVNVGADKVEILVADKLNPSDGSELILRKDSFLIQSEKTISYGPIYYSNSIPDSMLVTTKKNNLKLNISDTSNKWIGKWQQPFNDTAYNLNLTGVIYDSITGDAFFPFRNSSFYRPSELYPGTPMTFKYINNIIDLTNIIYRAKISSISGAITFNASYNDSSKLVRLSVEPNTQYRVYFYPSGTTFYKKVRFENASQQLISFTTTSPSYTVDTFTFTTPSNCVFVVINLNEQSGFGASVGTWSDNTDILTMVKTSEGLIQGVYTINSKTLAASTGYNLKIKTQITEDEDAVSKGWSNDWDSRVEWVQFLYPKDSFSSFTHNLYRKGNTYTSDYDWTLVRDAITGDTVWVDPRVISSGSGSKASPLKSIHEATALVNSNNTYGAVAYVPFWYNYSEGPQGVVPNRSIKYILNGTGVATWSTHIPLTYSLFNSPTYTAVYSATYADTANNVAIIDLTKLDSFGLPIRYKRFASAINVNLNPGSYYYDRTNDVVYVKTFDGRAVDSNIRNLFSLSNVVLTNDEDSYLEYTKVWGGGDNAASIFNSNVSTPKTFVDMYCQFNYSTQQDLANTNINGIQASGNTVVYHYRSHSSYNETDGFDYFEDENIGMSAHGYEERTVGNFNGFQLNGSANNGSTGHRDAQVIRNGCVYVANEGRQVADIDNVRCYNVGILAGLSTAIDPFARYSYSMGRPTANSTATRSWFIECNSLDEKGFQLFDKSVTRINAGNFDVLKGNSIYPVATVFNLTKYRDIILK